MSSTKSDLDLPDFLIHWFGLFQKDAMEVSIEIVIEKLLHAAKDDVAKVSSEAHQMLDYCIDSVIVPLLVNDDEKTLEEHNDLVGKQRKVIRCIKEMKKVAAKASLKRGGGFASDKAFAAALSKEMNSLRVERERERDFLMEKNRKRKVWLRDTAETVSAAGAVLVSMREVNDTLLLAEVLHYVNCSQQSESSMFKEIDEKLHSPQRAVFCKNHTSS